MTTAQLGFAYLLNPERFPQPRTLHAAIKGLRAGVIPPEAAMTLFAELRPLLSEPYDLALMDRLLFQVSLDLKTARRLADVLEKMTRSREGELALFASESLTALAKIFRERDHAAELARVEEPTSRPAHRAWVRGALALAILHRSYPAIHAHYAREALARVRERPCRKMADVLLRTVIWRELGHPGRALELVERWRKRHAYHERLELQRIELLFLTGRSAQVAQALAGLRLPVQSQRAKRWILFWLSEAPAGSSP